MKAFTPQEELWIERGMTLGRWLDNQVKALAHLGGRGFRQHVHGSRHDHPKWQASAH